jgi:hypothetical protein
MGARGQADAELVDAAVADGGRRARRVEVMQDIVNLQKSLVVVSKAISTLKFDHEFWVELDEQHHLEQARSKVLDAATELEQAATRVARSLGVQE